MDDNRAIQLGLSKLYDGDVFLSTYPRSGTTFTRFILTYLQYPQLDKATYADANIAVPGLERAMTFPKKNPRIISTHLPLFKYFPKFVYVVRDPRDALVSNYHYFQSHHQFTGTFEDYFRLRYTLEEKYGTWEQHVQAALLEMDARPDQVLLLQFEDLKVDPVPQIKRIAEFAGLDASDELCQQVAEKTAFRKLKEMAGPQTKFFRKGKSGAWSDYFTPELHEQLLVQADAIMKRLKYVDPA